MRATPSLGDLECGEGQVRWDPSCAGQHERQPAGQACRRGPGHGLCPSVGPALLWPAVTRQGNQAGRRPRLSLTGPLVWPTKGLGTGQPDTGSPDTQWGRPPGGFEGTQ